MCCFFVFVLVVFTQLLSTSVAPGAKLIGEDLHFEVWCERLSVSQDLPVTDAGVRGYYRGKLSKELHLFQLHLSWKFNVGPRSLPLKWMTKMLGGPMETPLQLMPPWPNHLTVTLSCKILPRNLTCSRLQTINVIGPNDAYL